MSRLLALSTTRKAVVNTFRYDIGESKRWMGQYPAIGWGRPAELIVVKLNLSCPYQQHRLPLRQSTAVYQPPNAVPDIVHPCGHSRMPGR